ncbi:unnamed protein product [Spirodela intermedia]|uniref:Tudor domain-containing protein n=1 Tax=Spirodela intermedia TaxID=51605 RepID=A0A7I8LHQ2_SPIIN|nr:unnamed protein product [Spirodela intermedia]
MGLGRVQSNLAQNKGGKTALCVLEIDETLDDLPQWREQFVLAGRFRSSEEKHDGSHPTRKSKSFDLLGLHEEKSEASIRSRETRPTEENGIPDGHLRKERRNDSPPSAIQSAVKTHHEDSNISGSFSYGFDSGIEKSYSLSGSRGISCIPPGESNASDALENVTVSPPQKTDKSNLSSNGRYLSILGGDASIPRRPRGVLKRKNSPTIIKEASGLFTSIRKSKSRSSNSKLSSHPIIPTQQDRLFVGKRKKIYDDKENGSSRCNSVEHSKQENATSLHKIHKKTKRSRRQRQDASTGKLKHVVGESISFEDYNEDDEESLEQNAARMLSSRFDPRCTELSGDKSSFPSKSLAKSSSCSPLTQGGRKSLGSVLSSPNAEGRALRPRKKRRKGYVKEQRHFYEVFTRTVDPYWVLERRISVFWPLDQSWYLGLIKDYNPITKLHHVKYDDRDEEWINLQGERFKLLLLPSEFMSKFCQGKLEFTVKEENVDGTLSTMDDNCASSVLESEPIISWLTRSTSRLKTSSSGILRDKRKSYLKKNISPSLLDKKEHAIGCPSGTNSKMHSTVNMPDGLTDEKTVEFPRAKKKRNCYDDMKFTFVYFRRRSAKKLETLENKWDKKDELCDLPYSTKLSASVLGGYCSLNHEASDITFTTLKHREKKLKFMLPLRWVPCLAWLSEYSWLYKKILLYHHGKLLPLWPPICMEIYLKLMSDSNRTFDSLGGSKVYICMGLKRLQKTSSKGFIRHLDHRLPADSHTCLPHSRMNGQTKSHPFAFSFAPVPALFFFLHFKLLVKRNAGSKSFKNTDAMPSLDCEESYEKSTNQCCSAVEYSSDKFSGSATENICSSRNQAVVGSRCLSCPQSKLEIHPLPSGNAGDCIRSFKTSLNNGHSLCKSHRSLGKDSQFLGQSFSRFWFVENPCNPLLEGSSSPEESEGGCGSFLSTLDIQTQAGELEGDIADRRLLTAKRSASDLPWSMDICSPDLTSPRTIWHWNRQNSVSTSVGHHSQFWPEDWDDLINGYEKPQTQISYASAFGGYDISPKSLSHHRKRQPYKRQRTNNAKDAVVGSESLMKNFDSLTCNANILVTTGDRGWREFGAQVALESDDHKDWRILVKVSGAKRYSYKAHQPLQPGATNRFTHAMMWKGGKDWTLEFTDRKEWSIFKELHQECCNLNIRAASVRHIPIPGVSFIDCDDLANEVPFVRNSKYFRQIGTEVDMALDPSRVLYDLDSEDEECISKLRNAGNGSESAFQGISEEQVEKAMDTLEKEAFAQHRSDFTETEIKSLMAEIGPVEVMKAVYEHWWQKRQKKGIPLIRQFQPPLWEQYHLQLKEWESAMSKMHSAPKELHGRTSSIDKPPMFAFCLRPRGLELPHKDSKQRSHKKFPSSGHHNSSPRDTHSLQGKRPSRPSLSKEKSTIAVPNYEFPNTPTSLQSPTGFPSQGFPSPSNKINLERSHHARLDRNSSKGRTSSSSRDQAAMAAASYSQRMKGTGASLPGTGFAPDRQKPERFPTQPADADEFSLRDASSAAQHSANVARFKREKAHWLMHKADLAIHKAVTILVAAEAINSFEQDESETDSGDLGGGGGGGGGGVGGSVNVWPANLMRHRSRTLDEEEEGGCVGAGHRPSVV